MWSAHRRAAAAALLLTLFATGGASAPPTALAAAPSAAADRFPQGTALVLYDVAHSRTYFATDTAVWAQQAEGTALPGKRTHATLPEPFLHHAPTSLAVSADGRLLLVRYTYDSFVLDAHDLHLVRRPRQGFSWWEGSRLGYLRLDDTGCAHTIVSGGRTRRVSSGRTGILAADSSMRYFLGARQLNGGRPETGNVPEYRMEIWERTGRGHFRRVRVFTRMRYDPGSTGSPEHWGAAGTRAAVFGQPLGGMLGLDFIYVLQGRRVTEGLSDRKGKPLFFVGPGPLTIGSAVVGLAEAIDLRDYGKPTGDRYLYRVTEGRLSLEPVPTNAEFVTYHPQRGLGLGLADKDGVTVTWKGW